ncbi:MAG TPA: bifunctional [glutamine synthetase] adenylyltransferase/[glutamine synthetase]-adenylyl-L-tyrosine phosphorylase [Actinomycetales bacterium]|nr:bifunctional [glutamine synthetase] adenylyltransferase/[glutamine synthetase]-adenylyl-L-tyrosine phosphorylase [Actinomycetales bacterium]
MSPAARLARLGFSDPGRAQALLLDPALSGLADPMDVDFAEGLLPALGEAPDPDLALLSLVRLMESVRQLVQRDPDDPALAAADVAHLLQALRVGGPVRDRLIAVLGSSTALGDHLVRHPEHWTALVGTDDHGAGALRAELLVAVGADPHADEPTADVRGTEAYDRLRLAYRRRLLAVASRDLAESDPVARVADVARELADLAAAALEAGLAIARAELAADATPCRLAVIGMGKCGGRELNYVSDVDVVFVAEPRDADDEDGALTTADQLATGMMRACSAATAEGTLWPVDANLRPEGKDGPLVRTLASHVAYYERWAKTWEFQALLKARPVAGDLALGEAYVDAIAPFVWRAAQRDHFVEDVQAMRRRVEEQVPSREADRQIKLGPGGLRDVEFSVQLLQLVHGRADESLRHHGTLPAVQALAAGGYVGRDDGARLDGAYRLLRTLEHRVQLYRLRRTHLMPTGGDDLRRLGRQLGHRADPAGAVVKQWRTEAREVRRLHRRLFYRPLLSAVARLSPDEVRLSPDAARERLHALGYRDPAGALRHLQALTEGVSRRAAIQRQLLPALLGWFADEADPDAGLLAFRRVSDSLGTTHWYLKMLRDESAAAQRLAHVLARSRFAADLLQQAPETVALLGDEAGLQPRSADALRTEIEAAVARYDDPQRAIRAVRSLRRRELFRIATSDLVGRLQLADVGTALTQLTGAVVQGALAIATRVVEQQLGGAVPTRILVVAMGSLGAGEPGYGSDADVLFVHEPEDGADETQAQDAAVAVVSELRRLLAEPGPDPALALDADLRPEGRNGPVVRSLESYAAYYTRWSLVWEAQALLRATPLAGDLGLAERFVTLIDPIRWPPSGLSDADLREVRRMKARVESERLPRGADRTRHLKLGRGGLTDVEWCVQLLALCHAHDVPALRTPGTVPGLHAARDAGLLPTEDFEVLAHAWTFVSRLRNATVLWRGRPSDALPSGIRDLDGVARILGYPGGAAVVMDDDYRAATRRARAAAERVLYG